MKYEISISEDKTFVRIRVFGSITDEMNKEFAEKAILTARENNLLNHLVDVRQAQHVSSTFDQYQFAYKDMEQMLLDKKSSIAVLARADDQSHNFIETVFRNAGYNCKLFIDEETAINWLSEGFHRGPS